MAEKDSLHMVCMEPLLFTYRAPRTIGETLGEYEQQLRNEQQLSPRRAGETVQALSELLDPIEAPLVTLTPALVMTLVRQEAARHESLRLGAAPTRCLALARVERFFRFATARGYLPKNPFSRPESFPA